MFVRLLDDLILGLFYSNLKRETGGFELALIITLVLQADRLTQCASHPICVSEGGEMLMFALNESLLMIHCQILLL